MPTKVHVVKAMVFPVVMYRYERWTVKKGWAPKNWCLWTVVLKNLESPLDSKKIKSDSPKDINPEYSLEGLMLKLKLQYFGHLMWRADSLEESCCEKLRGGGEGGQEKETVGWHHWLDGHKFEQILGDDEGQGSLTCCSPWDPKESQTTEWLNSNSLIFVPTL